MSELRTCCACSGREAATLIDGAFWKPVCDIHARMYGEQGYPIVEAVS